MYYVHPPPSDLAVITDASPWGLGGVPVVSGGVPESLLELRKLSGAPTIGPRDSLDASEIMRFGFPVARLSIQLLLRKVL